jgi:hypothetical protein
MQSPDDTTQNTGPIQREPRPFNRRDYAYERRQSILQQKQTDPLPIPGSQSATANGKIVWRQFIQLREENKRLHWEIAEYTRALDTAQSDYQQELEHYRNQVEEMVEERDRTRQEYRQLERRFQELYHSFQSSVEEEAHNIVEQAARTLELTPENRPRMTNDALKTVELHVRQVEDKHTAETLYLLRQAQKKAKQLEQELASEREQIAAERENLYKLQVSAREQADLRKRVVEDRLRAQYALTLTLMCSVLLVLLPAFQVGLINFFHVPLTQTLLLALSAPILLCILLAAGFAHFRSSVHMLYLSAPHKKAEKK